MEGDILEVSTGCELMALRCSSRRRKERVRVTLSAYEGLLAMVLDHVPVDF